MMYHSLFGRLVFFVHNFLQPPILFEPPDVSAGPRAHRVPGLQHPNIQESTTNARDAMGQMTTSGQAGQESAGRLVDASLQHREP